MIFLDHAGFNSAKILASNDLDEYVISSLKEQGTLIDLWGVGTKLVTAFDQPALGGVYKLGAIRAKGGPWQNKVKLSEQAVKVSNPGSLQVRRFEHKNEYIADMIYNDFVETSKNRVIVDIADVTIRRSIGGTVQCHDLLVPIFRHGELVSERPSVGLSEPQPGTDRVGSLSCRRETPPQSPHLPRRSGTRASRIEGPVDASRPGRSAKTVKCIMKYE
jgi:nicotinate phosphoribosyltransferase